MFHDTVRDIPGSGYEIAWDLSQPPYPQGPICLACSPAIMIPCKAVTYCRPTVWLECHIHKWPRHGCLFKRIFRTSSNNGRISKWLLSWLASTNRSGGLGLGGVLRDRWWASWSLRLSEGHMHTRWAQDISSRGKTWFVWRMKNHPPWLHV